VALYIDEGLTYEAKLIMITTRGQIIVVVVVANSVIAYA
jgi:hypothetical protein